MSLGALSSIISQSAVGKAIIPRPITTSVIPFPIPEQGLVLWVDAANLSSLVFGANRTFGAGSYATVTSIKDSYKGIIASSKTGTNGDPIYVPSITSTFLTNADLTYQSLIFPNPRDKPALYFRGDGKFSEDSHAWTINQYGNPVTMFMVWQSTTPANGGVGCSNADIDSFLIGYGTAYDSTMIIDQSSEAIDIRGKRYTSYKNAVCCCIANRMNGATKQLIQRFNGMQTGSATVTSFNASQWYHNPNKLRTGRLNNENADMLLHEILVYNVMMTDAQIQRVESYLNTKWTLF